MPQVPPWVLAPEVVVVLNELDQRSVPLDRVRRETMLGKLGLGLQQTFLVSIRE